MEKLKITKADLGRQVVLRNGDVLTVEEFDGSSVPVRCGTRWYNENGTYFGGKRNDNRDVVGFRVEPSTLAPGKYYKTKSGAKAFVAAIPDGSPFHTRQDFAEYNVYGYVEGCSEPMWWTADGIELDDPDNNIVAAWVEPKRIKGWMNVYPPLSSLTGAVATGSGQAIWPTKAEADGIANPDRIACIEIDTLEGHGIEEKAA